MKLREVSVVSSKRISKVSQREPKVTKREPKGAKSEPKGSQWGAKSEALGGSRVPQVRQGATRMHRKIELRKRSRKFKKTCEP